VESLASFRQTWVLRRFGAAAVCTLVIRAAVPILLILAGGLLLPAEGQAGGQASVQASVTIVDTRVGRAALAEAAEVVSELSRAAEPELGVRARGLPLDNGSGEWSDESGLFSVRLVNSHNPIDVDSLTDALEGPLRLEIQFLAN
jgi:hypothetical protein